MNDDSKNMWKSEDVHNLFFQILHKMENSCKKYLIHYHYYKHLEWTDKLILLMCKEIILISIWRLVDPIYPRFSLLILLNFQGFKLCTLQNIQFQVRLPTSLVKIKMFPDNLFWSMFGCWSTYVWYSHEIFQHK